MSLVTALMSSVTTLYRRVLAVYQHFAMLPSTSPFCGLARTAELRAAIGITQEPGAQTATIANDIEHVPFFSLSDEAVVELVTDAFSPELQHLRDASPTVEATSRTPLGNLGPNKDQTPSRLIYGADHAEVNRSIVGVLALKWLINRDYEALTAHQPPDLKLRRESFDALREYVMSYLRTAEQLYALVVATFANDLGKDASMHGEIEQYLPAGAQKVNHDEVIYLAATHHDVAIIDEFPARNPVHEALILGLKLGAKLNVSQFAQAENVPGSLSSVTVMQGRPDAFNLKFLEIIFDVGGAQGHNDARGALNLTEPVWTSYSTTRGILLDIAQNKLTLRQGYDAMLAQRARVLVGAGWTELHVEDPASRALLRLLSMGRVTEAAVAGRFADALDRLDAPVRQALVDGLSVDGIDDGTAVIPYYAPSLFANALRLTTDLTARQQIRALQAVLRLLARVYDGSKPQPEKKRGKIVECYLDFAREVIGDAQFATNPGMLDQLEIPAPAYTVPRAQWDVYDGA